MVGLKKALGERLRQMRDEQELKVEQVAAWAGFDRTHLYAVERGATWPSVELLGSLAQIYRVDVADFFVFPNEHRRHRFRELARLVPNSRLPDIIAAVEAVMGASVEVVTDAGQAATPARRRRKKSR